MWNSKPFVIFLCVVTSVSLLFLFLASRKVQFYEHLLDNGIQAQGKIVDHLVRKGNKGYGQNHYFIYRFLDTQNLLHENQVNRNEPDNRFKVGKNIEITYDPLDPDRNIPSVMFPDNIYQPIDFSLKFMSGALVLTIAFGAFVFSRFARTKLRSASLKRLFGGMGDHNK